MDILKIALLALAGWRLTSLLSSEDGPLDVFKRVREAVGITHYQDGGICETPDKFWCKLLSCPWCLSVWVSGLLTSAYIFLPQITIYFALWLGLSTITIMVNEWLVAQR